MKLQLALEFMIVFAFILIVFIFIFALVANQRAVLVSGETFSQLQALAQQVALQLTTAQQAGSGYSATVPISGSVGVLKFNVSVTPGGAVIVQALSGKQILRAVAYSSASNVRSNGAFFSSNAYLVPITNGSVSIQNSFGVVCVDLACPTTSTAASSLSLYEQSAQAAEFNGQDSVINVNDYPGNDISPNSTFTISAWVEPAALPTPAPEIAAYVGNFCTGTGGGGFGIGIGDGTGSGGSNLIGFFGDVAWVNSGYVLPSPGRWYDILITRGGGVTSFYVDGVKTSATSTATPIGPMGTLVQIGGLTTGLPACNGLFAFDGSETNVQVYNSTFSASNALALYDEGISGVPLSSSNITGWWPLNGNANDYAEGSDGSISGPVLFTSVSEFIAKVANGIGQPVSGALVGFASSFASLSNSIVSYSNYTDADGYAAAFLSQLQTNGRATVSATAFNGNATTQNGLIGWWPLSLGQGTSAADLASSGGTGAIGGLASWAEPTYAMSFDGTSGYVSVPNTAALNPTTFTVNLWFNPSLYGNGGDGLTSPNPLSQSTSMIAGHGFYGMWWFEFGDNGCIYWSIDAPLIPTVQPPAQPFSTLPCTPPQLNQWYMLSGTYNSVNSELELFVNGVPVANGIAAGPIVPDTNNVLFGGTNASSTPGGRFAGKLADVQVYSSVLQASQLQQLYQEGVAGAPIGNAMLQGWWPLDGDAHDHSGNGDNGTIHGGVAPVALGPNSTDNQSSFLAASFNGVSSDISLPLDVQTPGVTLTMWVAPNSLASMQSTTGYAVVSSSGQTDSVGFLLSNGLGQGAVPGDGDEELVIGANVYKGYGINATSWSFVAVSLKNGVATFYANDSMPYSVQIPGGTFLLNSFNLGNAAYGVNAFNGLLANFQVYNGTLTPAQISKVYGSGITGVPLQGAGLLAWYPLAGTAEDYSGNGNAGITSNVAYSAQTAVKPTLINSAGDYGVAFKDYPPGSGNVLVNAPLTISVPFTISFWMYKDAYMGSCDPVIAKDSCSSSMCIYAQTENGCSAGYSQGAPLTLSYAGGSSNLDSAPIPAQTWTFVTLVYNGLSNEAIWYINGRSSPATNYTGLTNPGANSNPFVIGGGGASSFNGTLADVQLYNSALGPVQVAQLYNAGLPPAASAAVSLGASP